MACRIVKSVCKRAGERKPWGFDYAAFDPDTGAWGFLVRSWQPGAPYESGVCVRPSLPTGLQYSSSGGNSAAVEPRWPKVVGGTVTDGTITWTAEAVSNDSLIATIASSVWSVDDTSLVLDDEALVNTNGTQIASLHADGGVEGTTYYVVNTITLSDGSEEESVLKVTVN